MQSAVLTRNEERLGNDRKFFEEIQVHLNSKSFIQTFLGKVQGKLIFFKF